MYQITNVLKTKSIRNNNVTQMYLILKWISQICKKRPLVNASLIKIWEY
jgi:hypothetical protein